MLADWTKSELGIYLPPRNRRRYDRPIAIDLFCGAGGFGLGFHQAGFHVAAAVEFDVDASLTYLTNLARPNVQIHIDPQHPIHAGARSAKPHQRKRSRQRAKAVPFDAHIGTGWISGQPGEPGCEHFYLYDIHNLTGERILDDLDIDQGDVDCVTGGPPCQGFSVAGQRDVMDPRNSLVFEFARLICEIQPKTFVMENVPGIASMRTPEGIPVIDALCHAVSSGGYGDYEALRRALNATGARAAVRAAAQKPSSAAEADFAEDLALFEVST